MQGEAIGSRLTVERSKLEKLTSQDKQLRTHFRFGEALLGRGHGRDLDRSILQREPCASD